MKKHFLALTLFSFFAFVPQSTNDCDCDDIRVKLDRLLIDLNKTKDLLDELHTAHIENQNLLVAQTDSLNTLREKLKNYESEGDIEYFRKLKAELWKLRSEIREVKKKNDALIVENSELKLKK